MQPDWADEKAQDIVGGQPVGRMIATAIREAEAKGRRAGIEAAAQVATDDAARCMQEGSGSPSHALRIAGQIRALSQEGQS